MAKYILDGALRWLNRDDWAMQFEVLYHQHTSSTARALELEVEDIADILGPHHFSQISGWVFEDLLTRTLEDGRNLANDYLKRRGWKETARTRAYIAALRDSVVSIYEVSGLVPGESFLARDLIRGGEPIRVLERSGSRSMRPWDRLATRIMPRGDAFEMSGGTLLFTYDAAQKLIMPLRSAAADATAQEWTTILAKAAPAFTEAWLLASIPPLTGRLPTLTNTDGDELAPSTTLYPLRADVPREDLIAALEREDSLPSAGTDVWRWMGDGDVVLGSVELTEDSLWLTTNSPARMTRFRALIEPAIAGLVGAPFSEVQSTDEATIALPTGSDPPPDMSAAEQQEMTRRMLDRHYTAVLDEPVPFLGGLAPRAAVGTDEGRAKAVDWLKYLENRASKVRPGEPVCGYDFTWMWECLGIAHLRH